MNIATLLSVILMMNMLCNSSTDKEQQQVINSEKFELSYGDTLQYELGYFGDEESAKIIKKPTYNSYSGFCSENREPLIYCYKANVRFEGKDTVKIEVRRGSGGSGPNPNSEITELVIDLKRQ